MSKNKENFGIGDEWLYYKIYSGPKVLEMLLLEISKKFIDKMQEEKIIQKWFFIRYSDFGYHLRLRFHFESTENIGYFIQKFNKLLHPYVENQLVWKVQIENYEREISRYSADLMETTESFFHIDTLFVIRCLSIFNTSEYENKDEVRWLTSLVAINDFLNSFGYSLNSKMEMMEILKNSFALEFNMDKYLKIQLDKKFRKNRENIDDFLKDSYLKSEHPLLYTSLRKKEKEMKPFIDNVKETKQSEFIQTFVFDNIHMMMNRMFRTKNRKHELVIYYFLFKFYASEVGKLKKEKKK